MPVLVEYHGALGVTHLLVGVNHLECLLCDGVVELAALHVELVDARCQLLGMIVVGRQQQSHRVGGFLQTSRSVDAWPDKKHQVANGQLSFQNVLCVALRDGIVVTTVDVGVAQYRLYARTRLLVQELQSEICQNPVFASDRHDVGSNADRNIIKQLVDFLYRSAQSH